MERLDKILANTGRWSRKEARELIRAGRVSVDGVTARAPEDKADPAAVFTVDGERIRALMAALKELGTPVLLSSHEALVRSLADRVVCLDGPPLKILEQKEA